MKQPIDEWRRGRQAALAVRDAERHFDPAFYATQVNEDFSDVAAAWAHYREWGARHRISPHPLFDAAYYAYIYPDLQGVSDVFEHFIAAGDGEFRKPHGLFDPSFYTNEHLSADCDSKVTEPWRHYLECESIVACTPLWNPVEKLSLEPTPLGRPELLRYITGYGLDGAICHPLFDEDYVRAQMPHDPRRSGTPPLLWYASRTGDSRADVAPNPFFDQRWYVAQEVTLEWHESPLSHFVKSSGRVMTHPSLAPEVVRLVEEAFGTVPGGAIAALMAWLRWDPPAAAKRGDDVDVLVINIDNATITLVSIALAQRQLMQAQVSHSFWVLDNASTEKIEMDLLRAYLPEGSLRTTSHRRSFGESNNLLSEQGTAEILLLLNNDAFVSDSALPRLIDCLADPEVAAAGPAFIYPDGRFQEVGGQFTRDGMPIQLCKGFQSIPDGWERPAETDYISAACLLVRRTCFEAVGGFSFVFEPAYFEDTDLCRRLKKIGRLLVDHASRVIHYEGHTTGKLSVLQDKLATQALARDKFINAFNSPLPEAMFTPNVSPAEDRKMVGLAVLYSPYGLVTGGGERYLLSMAAALATDYEVMLAFDGPYSNLRLRNVQDSLGLQRQRMRIIDATDPASLPPVDIWVVMANSLHPPLAARGRVANIYHCQFPFDTSSDFDITAAEMLAGYDAVLVNSRFTADVYRRKASRVGVVPEVVVVHPPCQTGPLDSGSVFSTKAPRILSVGRFFSAGHSKRQDAAVEAFRKIRSRMDDCELTLVGGVADQAGAIDYYRSVTQAASGLPVRFMPDATRMQVQRELATCRFFWHCTGLGVPDSQPERLEHFGISVVEAMSYGAVPVVHARGGPAEVVAQLDPTLLVRDVNGYASVTEEIWRDTDRYLELSERARAIAQDYSDQRFAEGFGAFLNESLLGGHPR